MTSGLNIEQHTHQATSLGADDPEWVCFHCGLPCADRSYSKEENVFCCRGCLIVYELLEEHGLQRFYELDDRPGIQPRDTADTRLEYLNEESIRRRLLDFTNGSISRVTFHIPAIHCVACVWLLENLFRLRPGIGDAKVHFPRKEVSITFEEAKVSLSGLVGLLVSLGYEPTLNLTDLDESGVDPTIRGLYLKLGIAGFAFGNIMLLSIPSYLGMNRIDDEAFSRFFGFISMILALPVLLYSALDYWRAAWTGIREKILTIDMPIVLGSTALFVQSTFDILSGGGEGYLDSFTGLVFFLLCGKLFQRKTYDALSFDRDYKSFFPLSVTRKESAGEAVVPITKLNIGDHLIIRNGELIPADARLIEGPALIDYSFITGESEPVTLQSGEYMYAGGRQVGGVIELETVKKVSQSYLTSLWNQEVFSKDTKDPVKNLTDHVSKYFTFAVIALASAAGLYWAVVDTSLAVRAFSAVLIVACPCALALSAPFALGSALRIMGRGGFFLKNTGVIETLAGIKAVIFDKTGTLTPAGVHRMRYLGRALSKWEQEAVGSLARHSTHPYSVRLARSLGSENVFKPVASFEEVPGSGLRGWIEGNMVVIGSRPWMERQDLSVPPLEDEGAFASVHLAVDGMYAGRFTLSSEYRSDLRDLSKQLGDRFELAVLSGDQQREREMRFLTELFGPGVELRFRQSPLDKLDYIRRLQKTGHKVMMVGDGLNDAGALKQSDSGVAVSEDITAFTPACDGILDAGRLSRIPVYLRYARITMSVVKISFAISFMYNVVGIFFAAKGALSPLLCAILMPLSSVSVVLFAVSATSLIGRRLGVSDADRGKVMIG